MGTAASLQVVNKTSATVDVSVFNIQCMYDNGEYGSNLQVFNSQVGAGESLPSSPQFIETDAGLGCVVAASAFSMAFEGIGEIILQCERDVYSPAENFNPAQINIDIVAGDHAFTITVSLLPLDRAAS